LSNGEIGLKNTRFLIKLPPYNQRRQHNYQIYRRLSLNSQLKIIPYRQKRLDVVGKLNEKTWINLLRNFDTGCYILPQGEKYNENNSYYLIFYIYNILSIYCGNQYLDYNEL